MPDVNVRNLQTSDRGEWQELWASYNAFYGREGETALPQSVVDMAWQRLLDRAEPMQGLVVDMDGSLVGLAHIIFHRNMLQKADTCYIQDLFTKPEMRGLTIARQLIAAIEQVCLRRGVNDIYWHTHTSNVAARTLYDKVARNTGFLVYRMKMDDLT